MTARIQDHLKNISAFDVLLMSLTASLFFFIAVSFQLLPLNAILLNNADVLFIEEVARDLNAGGNLFDWRLTQAPYLFPDITLARLIALFVAEVGKVGVYYHAIFGALLIGLVYWMCMLARVRAFLPVLFTAILYSIAYFGGLSGDTISVYFGLIGHHTGVAISLLLAMAALMLFVDGTSHDVLALSMLYFSAFTGIVSDSLFAIAFLPPLLVFIALCLARREISVAKAVKALGITALAILMGKAFGYTNPFPQDREFLQIFMSQFPTLAPGAFQKFRTDFFHYFATNRISAFIALLFFSACFIALRHLMDAARRIEPARSALTLLSLFVLLSPVTAMVAQILLGLYVDIDSSRQWASLVFISIAFGAIIGTHRYAARRNIQRSLLLLVLLIFVFHVTRSLGVNRGVTRDAEEFSPVVECMKQNKMPSGALYVSDYWLARPIRLYSHGVYGVSAYGGLMPFPNASNVAKARKATPRFIITGISVDYNEVVKRFGPPSAEHCRMIVGSADMRILDYSDNEKAQAYLRDNAIKSY